MAGNFLMEHNFSPRWASPRQRSGSHGQSGVVDDEYGSHRGHFGLDALAHFIHAFNAHGGADKAPSSARADQRKVHPFFDLVESRDDFKIYGELPGLASEDLHVDVNDHLFTVTVSGRFDMPTEIAAALLPQHEAQADAVAVTHKDAAGSGKGSEDSKEAAVAATGKKEPEQPVGEEPLEKQEGAAEGEEKSEGKSEGKAAAKEEEKEEKEEEPNIKYHIRERKLGSFKRAFQFPVEVVCMEKVSAQCRNGLLTITVPKNPAPVERKGRKLDVV